MRNKGFIPPQGVSVVKATLGRLSKEQFAIHAQFYHLQAQMANQGSKEERYYAGIFNWCKEYWQGNFL